VTASTCGGLNQMQRSLIPNSPSRLLSSFGGLGELDCESGPMD